MNIIKFRASRFFLFFAFVTIAVNMICLIRQYFSLKRMWQTEKAYHAVRKEEMQMKFDVDEALREKCKKHGII